MAAEVHHPLFARLYALMSRREPPALSDHRRTLLAGLQGRVVEVGAGAGANFGHYPRGVTEVVAVEPEPYLRERARAAATRAPVRVTVLEGTAERLPLPDAGCDAAVACLMLCSVSDQALALAELRRALRPHGELRFYEHVLSERRALAAGQRLVDRTFWPRDSAAVTPLAIRPRPSRQLGLPSRISGVCGWLRWRLRHWWPPTSWVELVAASGAG